MAKTRDQYVAELKKQLDRWNAEIDRWEGRGEKMRADMRKRYDKDMRLLRAEQEKALYQLKLLEGASNTAWQELCAGADEAWDRMRASIEKARGYFAKA